MDSHHFLQQVNAYCYLYEARVVDFLVGHYEAEITEGLVALKTIEPPRAVVSYAVQQHPPTLNVATNEVEPGGPRLMIPEEAGATVEAGRRGLKLTRQGEVDILVPA